MPILKDAPAGAEVLDLGAARAARAEAFKGVPNSVIKLSAGYVEVAHELDVLCAEDFTAGRIRTGLGKLLAHPDDIDLVVAEGLTNDDLQAIVKFVTGNSLGE